jgi:hypothetical protein
VTHVVGTPGVRRLAVWITVVVLVALAGCAPGRHRQGSHNTTTSSSVGTTSQGTTASSTSSTNVAGSTTLTIVSPRSGDTVTPPWHVDYDIAGTSAGAAGPAAIRITSPSSPGASVDVAIAALSGSAEVPDDPQLTGRRNLVFTLLRADGTPYGGRGASYVVEDVTIAGNR